MIVNTKPTQHRAVTVTRHTVPPANTRCVVYLPAVFIHEVGFLQRKTRTNPPGSGLPDLLNQIKFELRLSSRRYRYLRQLTMESISEYVTLALCSDERY